MCRVRSVRVSLLLFLTVIGCSGSAPVPSGGGIANQAAPAEPTQDASTPSAPAESAAPAAAGAGTGNAVADEAAAAEPTGPITPDSVNRPTPMPAWAGQPGEPFDVRQYLESRQPSADNAAPLYLMPFAQISGELPNLFPDGEREQQLLVARALAKSVGDLTVAIDDRPDSVQRQDVERVLHSVASIVSQVDQAQSRPSCVFITSVSADALLPHVQAARNLARLFKVQTYLSTVAGDQALAIAAARRSLRLSRDLRPRGMAVSQLVSIAIENVSLDATARHTLNAPYLSPELCDQLLALLVEHQQQGLDGNRESLHMEYIGLRQTLEDIRSGRISGENLKEMLGIPGNQGPSLETINYEAEVAAANRIYAAALRDAGRPYPEAAQSGEFQVEWQTQMSAVKSGSSAAAPLTSLFTQTLAAIRDASARGQTCLAATQSLIAIRRFELAHRYLPENLEEAAAETVLKTVPLDRYSGQPLLYAVIDARPTVYSVGKDLKDDGGRVDWKFGQQPGDYIFALSPLTSTGQRPTATPRAAEKTATTATPTTSPAPASSRSWTSTSGTKVSAEFVKLENNVAFLKKDDGRILQVPIDKLSEPDQRWIREHASR